MEALLDRLSAVSLLGPSPEALIVVLGLSCAFTALHSFQEWKGQGGPLWRNFGAIVGLYVPSWLGFALFTVGLVLGLWALAFAGIAGWLPFAGLLSSSASAAALAALIGARLSDTAISHVLLHQLGYRPNPGLASTPLYVIEAVFIAVVFRKGLAADPAAVEYGFTGGVLFFALVLPGLWLLRLVVPSWRRSAWPRRHPMPAWASEP
jgi:hypothetical protein